MAASVDQKLLRTTKFPPVSFCELQTSDNKLLMLIIESFTGVQPEGRHAKGQL